MPGEDGFVEVAHVGQAEDVHPVQVLLEDVEHLVLSDEVVEPRGVVVRRYAQQDAVIVLDDVKHLDVSRAWHEAAVVVVHRVAQSVVDRIEAARGGEQLDFVIHPAVVEELHGFARAAFDAAEWHVGIDQLAHPCADARHVVLGHRFADVQMAVVAARHGVLELDAAHGIEVGDGFAQDEAQRADVGAHGRHVAHVEVFDVLVLVEPEVEAFGHVVHPRAHQTVGHVEAKLAGRSEQCRARLYGCCLTCILAINL